MRQLLKALGSGGVPLPTLASLAVQRATEALRNSAEWEEYMEGEGALILLPRALQRVGRGGEAKGRGPRKVS